MATKVRFTDESGRGRTPAQLLEVVHEATQITYKNVYKITNGAILLVPNANLPDLLSSDTMNKLREKNITVYPPAEFQAQRTIFVHRIHDIIMDHSNDEIIAEIERKNRDVKILQAHRFTTQRNNQVLKLTLASPEQATQVCTQGLSAFGIMAEPDKIHPQRFYKLKQCFKCFQQEAIKQLHETETAARQQAAITIPAPPPPVNAWGIPNQQQAQSVAQVGHQSTQHPHNPTVIPEQTQNQTQQAPTPNSLAPNPDPKPSLGAELLTFAQIQFPDNPVKLLGFWNSLRKDNGLPPVHMSEDSLAYLTPNISTTAGQAQAQPNNPNPSTPRPQASTNAQETPNSLNNPGPSTPISWETPMSTLPETIPHQILLKAITNSLAIRNPIRPRKFRFKHRSPTTIYSTQRGTKRPRTNTYSRTPSPGDGARASSPHNSPPESDSSTTDVDIMNSSDTEDPSMTQQRMENPYPNQSPTGTRNKIPGSTALPPSSTNRSDQTECNNIGTTAKQTLPSHSQ
nr:proteoglycan 4-like [Procambarus clarkii]